jgi:two-component system sensor histidine kinase KdpD
MLRKGELRVYLGAAPGVGKTFAMLGEGRRRRDRGADVVIGFVETHGRAATAERIGDLERAIANLVDNAVSVSPPGRPVRIQAGAIAGRIDVRVIDQGPGIPRDERERVFQPFQRLVDHGSGVGLGLAIARGFVEAMGGDLTLEDTPGGGVTMVVSLPEAAS